MFQRPVIGAALFKRFMRGPLNPTSCPECGISIDAATPCAIERDGWTGVVLANPVQIDIAKAVEVVGYFLSRLQGRRCSELPIIVVGEEEQLRRILRRLPDERFNAVPFTHFISREWENQIENVKIAPDAYMAADKPERGYWMLIEAVGLFNELYVHPMMREPIEMAVLAAGDRIAPKLREPRSAAEDWERVRKVLEPHVPATPEWFETAYLCFFDDDRYFEGESAIFASELCRLDSDGGVDFRRSELHLTTTARQAIVRNRVRPVESATLDMLSLMFVGELQSDGIEIGDHDDVVMVQTLNAGFRATWDELLRPDDRYQIYKQYQRLTGGKDIRLEWNLPSHGLTFTIDRMESGDGYY